MTFEVHSVMFLWHESQISEYKIWCTDVLWKWIMLSREWERFWRNEWGVWKQGDEGECRWDNRFICSPLIYTVSQKNCAKLFLSELRQISTNFDNFWQKDGKEAKIMRGALIFHFIYFVSSHYRVKRKCSKLLGYTMLKVVICNKLSNDLISTQ